MVAPPAGLGEDIKKIQVVLSDRIFYVKTSINHVAMGIPVLLLQTCSVEWYVHNHMYRTES